MKFISCIFVPPLACPQGRTPLPTRLIGFGIFQPMPPIFGGANSFAGGSGKAETGLAEWLRGCKP
jgi:hypothetical protein